MNAIKALQSVAVLCVYLIMSIPVISAFQVSIFMPGGQKIDSSVSTSARVDRNITIVHDPADPRWENVLVKVEIAGKDPSYSVKKTFLFKCKDSSPAECSGYEPVEARNYLSGEKGTFYWRDISANSIAGFMSLAEMEHDGKTIWVGFWDQIERTGVTNFIQTKQELDYLNVYAKSGAEGGWIKNYMESYYMVPMRFVERVVLGTVEGKATSKMYKIGSDQADIGVHVFETGVEQGNSISSVINDYLFVLGRGSIASPVTLYAGFPFTCGNSECETGTGENSETCCLDCGCGNGENCSASADYPNGFCHVCGDGVLEPTETSDTCCADAGCPAGKSCDTARNPPYGTCVLPDCGNGRCDTPAENAESCCIDCGYDYGCTGLKGTGFYCNAELVRCMEPVCGNRDCEPLENYTNCCADCGGCPSGQYCYLNESVSGVCIPTDCGNGNCEPGESCCTDCNDCPLDSVTGMQMVCELNTCHICGNDVFESPAETEGTCCQDSGCANQNEYCSQNGNCTSVLEMGMYVMVLPDDVDCVLGNPVILKVNIENRPYHFGYLRSAYYSYAGYTKNIVCTEIGDAYECRIPTTGQESFAGCFEPGRKTINLTLDILYYRDGFAESVRNSTIASVSRLADVNVQKSRARVCNSNGACEPGTGESPDMCCYDCGCAPGLVCTSSGCADEDEITMQIDENSLPVREQVDCSVGRGDIKFSASVTNMPYSADDPFELVDWILVYGEENYSAENLPGFYCEPVANAQGMPTGSVECSIPVSVFPPCPHDPPATMKMKLYVLGGSLSDSYGEYTGKELSDDLRIDYIKGLPNCGNGEMDDGETSDNCCRDVGCAEGKICSLYSGCIEKSQIDINVSVDPSSLNCSRGSGEIEFRAEVDPKPVSLIWFEDTYLNRTGIDDYCEQDSRNIYILRCRIPLRDLPYCWETGAKAVTFETSLYYMVINDTERIDFAKPVEFVVESKRQRECRINWLCEYDIGEMPDQCCADCGCAGGKICALDNACKDSGEVSLMVDPVDPVDCSGKSGYMVTIGAEIMNQPYGIVNVDWYIRQGDNTYGSDIFSCGVIEGENKYECLISVYSLPLCHTHDTKTMTLMANMTHMDAAGYLHNLSVEDDITIETSGWLDSCTNPITGGDPVCQPELGEDQQTCCMDCGCSGFGPDFVCTQNGCRSKSSVALSLSPSNITAECTLLPAEADIGKSSGSITKYLCSFGRPVEIGANVENLPVHTTNPIDIYYYIDGDKNSKIYDFLAAEKRAGTGWMLKLKPRTIESKSAHIDREHKLGIGFSLAVYENGKEIAIPLESRNEIDIKYDIKKSEHLISVQNQLKDYEKNMAKLEGYMKIIFFVFGFCTPCFGEQLALSAEMVSFWQTLIGFYSYFLGALASYGIVIGIGYYTASSMGFTSAYIAGLALGWAFWASTCPDACAARCPTVTGPCKVFVVLAVFAMMFIMNKMNSMSTKAQTDVNKDIALAKADLGDDLSFYYE